MEICMSHLSITQSVWEDYYFTQKNTRRSIWLAYRLLRLPGSTFQRYISSRWKGESFAMRAKLRGHPRLIFDIHRDWTLYRRAALVYAYNLQTNLSNREPASRIAGCEVAKESNFSGPWKFAADVRVKDPTTESLKDRYAKLPDHRHFLSSSTRCRPGCIKWPKVMTLFSLPTSSILSHPVIDWLTDALLLYRCLNWLIESEDKQKVTDLDFLMW